MLKKWRIQKLPVGLEGLLSRLVPRFVDITDGAKHDGKAGEQVDSLDAANIITSKLLAPGDKHIPIFDIDLPIYVLPSRTAGHSHLYINKEVTWEQLKAIMEAFVAAGIVEEGYQMASEKHGFTSLRLPWIKKQQKSLETSQDRAGDPH